jgi:hypothetical protein
LNLRQPLLEVQHVPLGRERGVLRGDKRFSWTWKVVEMMPPTPPSANRFSKFFQMSVTVPS